MRKMAVALILFFHPYTLAQEVEPNGAVPGLLDPVTELQFASRMEGKSLFYLNEAIIQIAPSMPFNKEIPSGFAKGMKIVGGERGKLGSYKIEGLETELAPIRIHINKLYEQLKESSDLNEAQKTALSAWIKRFRDADKSCQTNPTLANVDILSDVLSIETATVFAAAEKPEVVLLEAIMEASNLRQRMGMIEYYFTEVLKLYANRTDENLEKIETTNLIMDGVGIHPSVVLSKQKKLGQFTAITGFEKVYGTRVKKVGDRLKLVQKDGKLLPSKQAELKKLIADIEAFDINEGNREILVNASSLMGRAHNFLYHEDRIAPAALRVGVGIYIQNLYQLFALLLPKAQADVAAGKVKMQYQIGGLNIDCQFNAKKEIEFTFFGDRTVIDEQLDSTLRLAEQTLQTSSLKGEDRETLVDAIEALKQTQAMTGKYTSQTAWAEVSERVNQIHKLYKF